jgi:hypothetical protein
MVPPLPSPPQTMVSPLAAACFIAATTWASPTGVRMTLAP